MRQGRGWYCRSDENDGDEVAARESPGSSCCQRPGNHVPHNPASPAREAGDPHILDYESVNECMEGVCHIYEEHLKWQNPNTPSITYNISCLALWTNWWI
ncbi:hypothetical protein HPB49_002028 [Dermacentor silvarum]|uniref:Uncharacterized protein n=1 Tax=Dermacentor silvarum TaxID=543639 RepID=A0ACB8CUQ8_DERSI|nr:hypothetical protein HPB49_002028 [Dermacentor silvarum]